MNWHTGNIAEAVAESKAKDAIFVVYIEGQDEMTAKLDRFLSDSRVNSKLQSADFVAVKIQGESPTYAQFISLYKVVPVPSIFFIGNSGTPLDIATGIIASVEELVAKIDKVLVLAGKRASSEEEVPQEVETQEEVPTTSGSQMNEMAVQNETRRSIAGAEEGKSSDSKKRAEKQKADSEEEEEDTVEITVQPPPKGEKTEADQTATSSSAAESTAAALSGAAAAEKRAATAAAAAQAAAATTSSMLPNAMASMMPINVPLVPPTASSPTTDDDASVDVQNLIEQRRNERQEGQHRKDKEHELRRRREGAQAQQTQSKDQELKNLQERIRRERQQEQEQRERILAQIAADRAEQANRASMHADVQSINTVTTATTNMISPESSLSSVDETRLQIRLPGGITRTKAFAVEDHLTSVRVYVVQELLAGSNIREFTLATSYPRREFKTEDEEKTLIDLNLVPNAVLLVLKKEQTNSVVRTSTNLMNILASVFWAILTPATMAFEYLNKMGLQRVRQRLVQMVSNVGLTKPPGRATGTGNIAGMGVRVQNDASSRRNMDMFTLHATPAPGLPHTSQHDAAPPAAPSPAAAAAAAAPTILSHGGSPSQTKRPGSIRGPRYGESNIRRLADTTKDNEDDKTTYNGNSTQQQ